MLKMPGIPDRISDAGTQTENVSDTEGPPPPKQRKIKAKGPPLVPKLMWKVRNREDYTPSLHHPYAVKIYGDRIYVCEGLWPHSRVQVFDLLGHSVKKLAQGQVLPFDMTLTPEGNIAVTDHKDRTVKIIDQEGTHVTSWDSGMFDWPNGICLNKHQKYVITDWTVGKISTHDSDGHTIHSFKTSCNDDPEAMSCPEYVVLDSHGRIGFTDTYDHCVKVYSPHGRLLLKFGDKKDETQSKIRDPRGLCLDQNGNFVVADWGAETVKLYDPSGRWIRDMLTPEDEIRYPWGLDISSENTMVLSEHKLNSSPSLKLFKCL